MRDGLYSARERSRSRSSRRKCDGGIDNDDVDPDDDPLSSSHTLLHNYDKMMLSFEFHVEAMGGQTSSLSTTATRNDDGGVGKVRGGGGEGGGGGGGSSCRATVTSFFRVQSQGRSHGRERHIPIDVHRESQHEVRNRLPSETVVAIARSTEAHGGGGINDRRWT